MPAFATFASASSRGYTPITARPYLISMNEAGTEGGYTVVSWKNRSANRQMHVMYSVNGGGYVTAQTYVTQNTTSMTFYAGANTRNIRVRISYRTGLDTNMNVWSVSPTPISTRPHKPYFYNTTYYRLGSVAGIIGNNGTYTVWVDPYLNGDPNTTVTVSRDGTNVASNITTNQSFSYTNQGAVQNWTAQAYNSLTGLWSTANNQPAYVGFWGAMSYNVTPVSYSDTTRTFQVYYNGGASTLTHNGIIKSRVEYTASRYCDSCGCNVTLASYAIYLPDLTGFYNGYQSSDGFNTSNSGATYEAYETFSSYMLDNYNNYVGFYSSNGFYIGFSNSEC